MEWERWTVMSKRNKEFVDNGIQYTIENCEQNRHHLQYPMSATEVMITHYTFNSAKYILDKMEIPSSTYGYQKKNLQCVDNTHATIFVMYNLLHSTTPVIHIVAGSRYTPITMHFLGAYLEYDLHEQVWRDMLAVEAESALPFLGGSNSRFGSFSYQQRLRYHLPTNPLQPWFGSN